MGKIRVKTLGEEDQEKEQKKRDEYRREVKREKKQTKDGKIKTPGKSKGGERVVAAGPSEEELEKQAEIEKKVAEETNKTKPASVKKPRVRSKRYAENKSKIDRNNLYPLNDAIKLVKETANTKFSGSIDAHFNLTRKPKDLNLKKDKSLPISYEKKFPLAHAKIGRVSDTEKDVQDQLDKIVKKIGKSNIKKLTLSSTMGPGIKVLL